MHENETDWQEIGNCSPADLADRMERLPEEAAREVLIRRSPAEIAAVISELETEKAADLIREFDGTKLSETLRLEDSTGSYLEMTPERVRLHAEVALEVEAPGQAVVIRGNTVDFQRR